MKQAKNSAANSRCSFHARIIHEIDWLFNCFLDVSARIQFIEHIRMGTWKFFSFLKELLFKV